MKKILVVDDETDIRNVVKDILSKDYEVLTAKNANEGLKLIEKDGIDLVLLDILMPGMSTKEFLEKISKLKNKPKIAYLTIVEFCEEERDSLNKKDIEYIPKPFTADSLLQRVKKIIK